MRSLILPCCFLALLILAQPAFPAPGTYASLSVSLASTGTTCQQSNGTIVATASGGTAPYSYSIDGNTAQNNGDFLYLAAGLHTVTVTDAAGGSATASVTLINTFAPPTGVTNLIIPPTDCATKDAALDLAGMGGTPPYLYSIDETNYQSSYQFPNLSAGTYYTSVKDANGCVSPDNITRPIIIGSGTGCQVSEGGLGLSYTCDPFLSELVLISITGGTAPYQYSLDGITYQQSNAFYNLPAGLQTVWVKDANGQIFLYSAALVNRCTPVFSISAVSTGASCNGNDGAITVMPANGIGPYLYELPGGSFQSSTIFTGLAPGNYTITGIDGQNLQSSATITVPSNCLSLSAIPVSSTCGNSNGSIQVTASNGTPPYQYSKDGVNFQTQSTFSGLTAATYTITVHDASGKVNSITTVVGNIAGPVINSVTSTPSSCTGKDGTITINATGNATPLQYSLDDQTFQQSPQFLQLATNTYQVYVQDGNGCAAPVTSTTVGLTNNLTVAAGPDQTICEGSTTTLNAQSVANQFSWQPSTGLSDAAVANPIASPIVTTQYTVTAVSGACSASGALTVFVLPAPVPDAGQDTTICFGQNAQLNGSGGVSYSWTPDINLSNPNIADPIVLHPDSSITYTLQVTDANHCTSIQLEQVMITVTPPALLYAGNDTTISIGQPLQLEAIDVNQAGFIQYNWTPAQGLNNPSIPNPVATLTQSIVYVVSATTAAGCEGVDSIRIKVYAGPDIYVPNAFTPNGDGHNDILRPLAVGIRTFNYFIIFNRWGQEIFKTTNPSAGWDGYYGGRPELPGTFVWMVSGVDYEGHPIERKGTVILIR